MLAPPRSLSQRATSFIASCRQGIHQMPFFTRDPLTPFLTEQPPKPPCAGPIQELSPLRPIQGTHHSFSRILTTATHLTPAAQDGSDQTLTHPGSRSSAAARPLRHTPNKPSDRSEPPLTVIPHDQTIHSLRFSGRTAARMLLMRFERFLDQTTSRRTSTTRPRTSLPVNDHRHALARTPPSRPHARSTEFL